VCDDAQRLDVHNGLLLSALWDAAFDGGLVSFTNDGTVLASVELSAPHGPRLTARGRRDYPTCERQSSRPPRPPRLFEHVGLGQKYRAVHFCNISGQA